MNSQNPYRILFAGGGTGGHLFPAVAVAQKIKDLLPESEILFVGTKSKIEGKVIPELGFKFKSIWIKGFSRKLTLENILFPIKLVVSIIQSLLISLKFKPKVAVGSGGYVSGPAVFGASLLGARVVLLEQNSLPGVTTKILSKYADEIHISFDDSRKYIKYKDKIKFTGNPTRESLKALNKKEALLKFGLDADKKSVLILGGSLGAGSINNAVAGLLDGLAEKEIQVIWQTGKNYYEKYSRLSSKYVSINPFISDMNAAYSACDLLVSRAGATTLAEITALGVPSILIPSPNVAENHQYYNAKSLSDKNAAILIEDKFISMQLKNEILSVIFNYNKLEELKKNARLLGKPDAAEIIANNIIAYCKK